MHIFGALFKTGLLGYLTYLPTRQVEVQRFVLPGERTFAPDRSLPASEFYIVHPVLDAWISELSPDYGRHLDTLNIAGYNRTWRDKTALRGVLTADIVDYTRIMLDADLFRVFVHDFRKVAHKHCQSLEFFEVIQGDSLALVDRNPFNLISAIQKIAYDLWTGPYKAKLRAGCDYGIMVPMTLDGGANGPPMGLAYRTAARLESLSEPDTIIMTEEFLTELRNINSAVAYRELHDLPSASLPSHDGLFNIKKNNATDPDMWKRLYYVRMA
jgi:class 3 adenylate cyclase